MPICVHHFLLGKTRDLGSLDYFLGPVDLRIQFVKRNLKEPYELEHVLRIR